MFAKYEDLRKLLKNFWNEFDLNCAKQLHQFSIEPIEATMEFLTKTIPIVGNKCSSRVDLAGYELQNVELIGSGNMGKTETEFRSPWDVKVSDRLNLIIVSDCDNNRIQVFDLKSRQFISVIAVPSRALCIDEGYEHCNYRHPIIRYSSMTFNC